jgi:hypothetical protein
VDEESVRRWEVTTEQPSALGASMEIKKVATFAFKDGSLQFKWENAQSLFRVAHCTLTLTAYDQSETCDFEWMSAPVPSIQLRNEAPERYDLPNVTQLSLRPDDVVCLELKFTGMPGSSFSAYGRHLTLQDNQTAIRIPLESYYPNADNADVSVLLTLKNEGGAESIRALWLESSLRGPAVKLQQIPGELNIPGFKAVETELELSDTGIQDHFAQQRREVEEHSKKGQNVFGSNSNWGRLPVELRRLAAGRFVELQRQSPEFDKRKETLDTTLKTLEDRLEQTSDPKAKADLEERRKQNRQEAEELQKLRSEWEGLKEKHPELEDVYKKHLLKPEQVQFAKMHLSLEDYQKELQVWYDAMKRFVRALRNDGRLDYRLYVTVDGREIDLLITEGFLDGAPAAADVN